MLGDNLKELRQIHRYTQERLAEKLGVSRQAIAKWERGETVPDLNNLIELAELFKVTLDDLVNYDIEEHGVAMPPKGKHMLGSMIIDENRHIEISEKALTLFDWHIGDEILVLGDEKEGIALVKKEEFVKRIYDLYCVAKEE